MTGLGRGGQAARGGLRLPGGHGATLTYSAALYPHMRRTFLPDRAYSGPGGRVRLNIEMLPPTRELDRIKTLSEAREEVEAAWRHFVAVGDSGDWNAWADLHSEDCVWVEHHLGTFRGREAIRKAIVEVMRPVPMMEFPIGWVVIEGSRVVFYPWQVLPDPAGGGEIYRFGCVTILEYAGNGLWSYQEDLYNPAQGQAVFKRWMEAGGRLAEPPGDE